MNPARTIEGLRMRLGVKTLLVSGGMVAAMVTALTWAADASVGKGFAMLDQLAGARAIERGRAGLENAISGLSADVGDWSCWDDTFVFLEDQNEGYLESNLVPKSLSPMHLAAIVIMDTAGEPVVAHGFTSDFADFAPCPEGLVEWIASRRVWLNADEAGEAGIVCLPDGPLIVAIRPVLTSSCEGPARGCIAFAQRIDGRLMEEIRGFVLFDVSFEHRAQIDADDDSQDVSVLPLSNNEALCRFEVATLDGDIAGVMSIHIPREVHQQGQAALTYLRWALAGCGVAWGLSAWFGLRRLVIGRLERLSREVNEVAAAFDLGARVREQGRDELTQVGSAINALLVVRQEQSEVLAQQNIELERATDAAQAAARAKSEFLANMSHEIRTPMNAILGYADLASDPAIEPAQRADWMGTIRRNGEHLLALVNDILDLSKLEAGGMSVERVRCPVLDIVDDAVELLALRAREAGTTLEIVPAWPLPEAIESDPLRLRQILVNLLGNAIKFTAKGKVRIEVSYRGSTLHLGVRDTGIGMTQEQVGRLFQAFSQADSSTARKYGGTGLGLVISRRLAQLLGGDISVESEVGIGTVFTLSLAGVTVCGGLIASAAERTRNLAAPAISPAAARLAMRILLAEDGLDNQRLFSHVLRKAGAEVVVANNGREAVHAASSEAFDLILMDMQMPELDGVGATELLRQSGYARPIVALTANGHAEERERCLAAGCNGFLSKPISPATLVEACRTWNASPSTSPAQAA